MLDEHYDKVSLLLPMNGADNGTVFADCSSSPNVVTQYGDAKTVVAESKFYGSSAYFSGAGAYITVQDGADWHFGSEDFTAEAWCYVASLPAATTHLIGQFVGTAGTCSWHFGMVASGGAFFELSDNGGYQSAHSKISSAGVVSAGAWNHFALCRSGTTFRLFVNGVTVVSYSVSLTLFDATTPLSLAGTSAGQLLTGYMQDARLTKGFARYTEAFTPPEKLCGYLSGTVMDKTNSSAERKVVAYRELGDAFSGSTLSDPATGAFTLPLAPRTPHRVIITGEPERNDLVFSGVVPK